MAGSSQSTLPRESKSGAALHPTPHPKFSLVVRISAHRLISGTFLSLSRALSLSLSLARALSRSSLVLWDSLHLPRTFKDAFLFYASPASLRLILIALPAASIIRAVHRSLSCASVCVSVSTKSSRRHLCPPPPPHSSFSLCHVAFLTKSSSCCA